MFVFQFLIRLVAALIAILIPIILARYIRQRYLYEYESPWRLFKIGCGTFVLSQIFHIPFNVVVLQSVGMENSVTLPTGRALVYLAIFAGLSAGVFEETTRYLAYQKYLTGPADRTWNAALMFGAGHGGVESILFVGVAGIAQLIGMTVLRGNNNAEDLANMGIPADQIPLMEQQIDEYWAIPWYQVLLGDVERVFAITCHLALTILVLQCFVGPRRSRMWLVAAIAWHALLDFLAVFLNGLYGVIVTEAAVAVIAAGSVGIIFYFRTEEDNYEEISSPPPGESQTEFRSLSETGPAAPNDATQSLESRPIS